MVRAGAPLPDDLARATLIARDGTHAELRELVGEGTTFVGFLRHFGCIGCADQVHDLVPRLGELDALGVRVLLVGNAPPPHIDPFVARNNLADKPVVVVTDPTLDAYRAAGFVRSTWATFGPRAVRDFVRALGRGHIPRPTDGDLVQQGGAMLVDHGTVVWFHENQSLGDHADSTDVVDVALRVVAARSPVLV